MAEERGWLKLEPTTIAPTTPEFSVCQFLKGGVHEYVARFVTLAKALQVFRDYTNNVASRIGITERVIVTDGGDCICVEWVQGKGIVFPMELADATRPTRDTPEA